MRIVQWTDTDGYARRSLLRDDDPDELARMGVPQDPPDLSQLDWKAIQRDLHNELSRRGLVSWQDVQQSQNGLTAAIGAALHRRLVALYRQVNRDK